MRTIHVNNVQLRLDATPGGLQHVLVLGDGLGDQLGVLGTIGELRELYAKAMSLPIPTEPTATGRVTVDDDDDRLGRLERRVDELYGLARTHGLIR